MEPDPVFAANLRRLLNERGMNARQLARRLAISPQSISQWLHLQTTPTGWRLKHVAEILKVSVATLTNDAIEIRGRTMMDSDWVAAEKIELDDKIGKLRAVLREPGDISHKQYRLLEIQLPIMQAYSQVLQTRLDDDQH